MKKFKKAVQFIFNYTTRSVVDAQTLRHETATYFRVFGFVVKTTYKPV
ncbi:hypothetical protein [Chryseobacterium sp. MFBS3-17]|nr:hypothetical protein [Chryseobacterium sp. MFBS3-17]MCC2590323.1 hypothetical protein [Chryseobacterium sp. MFBS3-17]